MSSMTIWTCDHCGSQVEADLWPSLVAAGWRSEGDEDVCPDCQPALPPETENE